MLFEVFNLWVMPVEMRVQAMSAVGVSPDEQRRCRCAWPTVGAGGDQCFEVVAGEPFDLLGGVVDAEAPPCVKNRPLARHWS